LRARLKTYTPYCGRVAINKSDRGLLMGDPMTLQKNPPSPPPFYEREGGRDFRGHFERDPIYEMDHLGMG